MHANSPLKRQEWLKECWKKQKKNHRAAQKGKVSVTEKPDILQKSEVTEKPERVKETVEPEVTLFWEDQAWWADKNRHFSSPEMSEYPARTSE